MGIEEIRNRKLSAHGQATIEALAGKTGEAIEDQMPKPPTKENPLPVNDVIFYGERVMEFYEYFSNKTGQSTAANLTLAAATLKASVVLGGLLKDLTGVIEHPMITAPAIPAKLPYTGKKRGRKPKVK
jgi:hypothetical protein